MGYFSKALIPAERNYTIYDQELLAIIEGLENWRYLLAGMTIPIIVLSNHENLKYWQMKQTVGRRVA